MKTEETKLILKVYEERDFDCVLFVYPIFLKNGKTEWVAEYPSLPYLVGGGDSPEEAVKEAEENKKVYIEECEADKAQSDGIKTLIKNKTNDELNVLHANFVNRLYEAKTINKQDKLMLKEIEDEMLQRILKEKDNV